MGVTVGFMGIIGMISNFEWEWANGRFKPQFRREKYGGNMVEIQQCTGAKPWRNGGATSRHANVNGDEYVTLW